jgi:hypothetical protein
MSTGLTYWALMDYSASVPDVPTTPMIFQSYQEAFEYGDWYLRATSNIGSYTTNIRVAIWTSSPNNNGWFTFVDGEVVFTAYD